MHEGGAMNTDLCNRCAHFVARLLILVVLLGYWNAADAAHMYSIPLTMKDRIHFQRAIEEVEWAHRIWPKENKSAKPALDAVLSEDAIRAKVGDYLRQSNALETYWLRPITPEQLQAEIDRMVRDSKQPAMLRELFAALDNDPHIIAECFARPILADRLIHNFYSHDDRFHGMLRQRVKSELTFTNTVDAMRSLSGTYTESTWKNVGAQKNFDQSGDGSISLDSVEWNDWMARLMNIFGRPRTARLPVGILSQLDEDAEKFYVVAVLEKNGAQIRIAAVEWKKKPFEEWWEDFSLQWQPEIKTSPHTYLLPRWKPSRQSTADNWLAVTATPSGRHRHTAIWTGTEMIIWGGQCSTGLLSTGGRYYPTTDSWAAGGTSIINAPGPRISHRAFWTGTLMVVWGGSDGNSSLNSGARYNPFNNTWIAITSTNAPLGRGAYSAVWTGSEMIVWGGLTSNGSFTQTGGRYNPITDAWVATSTTGAPTARHRHVAVWTGTQMIVWGGSTSVRLNTGGRYDPATNSWAAGGTSTSNAPSGRENTTAVWTGTHMIIWGGSDISIFFNSGGQYDPVADAWTSTNLSNAPIGRALHSVSWTGSEMIVWGGIWNDGAFHFENSGGRYDPVTDSWVATTVQSAPIGREEHSAVWTGTEMIVWGGTSTTGARQDGGRYNPSTDSWTPTAATNSPAERTIHTAVWTGTQMIVWGGLSVGGSFLQSGGRYFPAADSWLDTAVFGAPTARYLHTVLWTGTEMIVWGGFGDGGYLQSGGKYNPGTNTWTNGGTTLTNSPAGREFHTAIWTGNEMIIWGGFDGASYLNSGGRYTPSSDSWTASGVNSTGAPSSRDLHTAVWTGARMIVWGGFDGGNFLNTGGLYDPTTDSWAAAGTETTNAPSPRDFHTCIWSGTEMIVWGGSDAFNPSLNDGAKYNPSTDSWIATSLTGVPAGRVAHTAVWTGAQMIVWGGFSGTSGYQQTGGVYDPPTDTWSDTNPNNAPSGRGFHSAVWTANEMIIWGGNDQGSISNNGGRYTPPPPNTAPVAEDDSSETTIEDIQHSIVLLASDADGDSLSYSIVAPPLHGALSGTAPDVTYTPNANYNGPDSFTFQANDGIDDSNIATVSIVISPLNDPPIADNKSINTNEDTSSSVTLTGSDVDGNPLTFSVVSPPTQGSLSGTTPNITYTPNANYNGADSFTFKANDGAADSNIATVSITIASLNDVPDAVDDSANTLQDAPVLINVLANDSDPDGDNLSVTAISQGANGVVVNNNDGTITYTPNSGFSGADSFTYTISDGSGGNDTATVNVTVDPSCLFCDDFEDGVLATDWSYVKPQWTETGGDLIGTPTGSKAVALASPAFGGCVNCSIETSVSMTSSTGSRVWLLGWYVDSKNHVELLMKQASGTWILKQRSGGSIVAKVKGTLAIDPNVFYDVAVAFDGAKFTVTVDGSQLMQLTAAAAAPSGTIGFQVKSTVAHFGGILVQ